MASNQTGGGTAKHGRNVTKCQRYRSTNRLEKNKARKAAKHARHMEAAAVRTGYMAADAKVKRRKMSEDRKRRHSSMNAFYQSVGIKLDYSRPSTSEIAQGAK